jgi:hypothetical protein
VYSLSSSTTISIHTVIVISDWFITLTPDALPWSMNYFIPL